MEKRIKEQILEELKTNPYLREEEIKDRIIDQVLLESKDQQWTMVERNQVISKIFYSLCRYDVIQELLEDREISEIMINGPQDIFIERQGRLYREERAFESEEQLENILQTMVGKMNRSVNQSQPITDVRLEDGSRVNVVLKPVAIEGPVVTIRKFSKEFMTMEDLIRQGSLTNEAMEFLRILIACRYNIFISGGTSSGKTTFLNLLATFIPGDERIITIEDSAELDIRNIPNLVRLEVRTNNLEGEGGITIRSLIKTALRMRPDRIIVGEVRGEEAFDMLTAMNTGHDGSLSTGHANSARDMLLRLETMVVVGSGLGEEVAKKLIHSSIEVLVHLSREHNKRKVVGIYELNKEEGKELLNPIFVRKGGKTLEKIGEIQNREKIEIYGEKRMDHEVG